MIRRFVVVGAVALTLAAWWVIDRQRPGSLTWLERAGLAVGLTVGPVVALVYLTAGRRRTP